MFKGLQAWVFADLEGLRGLGLSGFSTGEIVAYLGLGFRVSEGLWD